MPSLPTRLQQPSPVNPQVPIPGEFPSIPKEIMDRFPNSAADWQRRLDEFWGRTAQAIQEAQKQTAAQVNSQVIFTVDRFLIYANGVPTPMFALDATGVRLGNVLVINTPGRKVYIGAGNFENDDTPFYIDTLGRFSLGASLTWNPETDTLTITGIINATSGTIGGFEIGADYIRDSGNSFGLASTVTGSADVRFWAGGTFANRGTAPVRIYENGDVVLATVTFSNTGGAVLNLESSSTSGQSIKFSTSAGTKAFVGLGDAVIGGQSVDDLLFLTPQGGSKYKFYTEANQLRAEITATGINSANIGATTPGTGAFTTLAANAGISNTGGQVTQTATVAAGSYGMQVLGAAGADRDVLLAGVSGVSNGFTVQSVSGNVVYTFGLASGNVMLANSTGLAVTGALSASGTISQNAANPVIQAVSSTLNNTAKFFFTDSTNSGQLMVSGGIGYLDAPTSLTIRDSNAANATRLVVSSTGLAVTGAVSTTDPAGGAGPNWKLGVAASVSPTAPNRTVRIEIAGTSYYLAAKTTND